MKKINLILLILLLLLCSDELFSQKIFRDGYIVKNNGEIFSGLVKYSVKQDIPAVCVFKRFDIAREVEYSSMDITAFGYKNGNRYESREVSNKKAFYEVIVSGKVTLYKKDKKYYIASDQLGFSEVKNGHISCVVAGENKEFNSLPEFLYFITEGKTGSISGKFNINNELINLISDYNSKTGINHIYNRSISEKQLTQASTQSGAFKNKFGLLGGISMYQLNIKSNSDILGTNLDFLVPAPEKETGYITGLTYERLLLRRTDRLSLRVDFLYTSQNFYFYKERILTVTRRNSVDDVFFNFSAVKFPVLLQYSLTGHRMVPFVNAGIAFQYFRKSDYIHYQLAQNYFDEYEPHELREFAFNKTEFSTVGGIGVRARISGNINLNLQLRVEKGNGMFVNRRDDLPDYIKKRPYIQSSFQSVFLFGISF